MKTTIHAELLPKDPRLLPSEGQEQAALFSWADLEAKHGRYPELRLMFHVPNGGGRSKAEAGRFKAEGVKAGVPDLFLPVPRGKYHGMFIEMKRRMGGRLSPEQKVWIAELNERGYHAVVACGWDEASNYIKDYLDIGRDKT